MPLLTRRETEERRRAKARKALVRAERRRATQEYNTRAAALRANLTERNR